MQRWRNEHDGPHSFRPRARGHILAVPGTGENRDQVVAGIKFIDNRVWYATFRFYPCPFQTTRLRLQESIEKQTAYLC